MQGMAGKASLLLAAFLFGIGSSGLLLLSMSDRSAWGPFRPQVQSPPQRVIVIDVGTPFTPPPLTELFAGAIEGSVQALSAEPAAAGGPPTASTGEPTPTPIPPLRIYGVAADDGVSAAGATPTPAPLRIVNVAVGEGETPGAEDATPAAEATPGDGAGE